MIGIDLAKIKETIVAELWKYTGLDVVDTDNPNKRPEYPYLSMKFLSMQPFEGEGNYENGLIPSNNDEFEHDIAEVVRIQPEFIISFQSYSNEPVEAMEYALKVHDYFKHGHRQIEGDSPMTALGEQNVVVIEVMAAQDRSTLTVNEYEYRWGLDVRFRASYEIKIRKQTIESGKFDIKGEY